MCAGEESHVEGNPEFTGTLENTDPEFTFFKTQTFKTRFVLPENEDTGSHQRVSQQGANGHHVYQGLQVKQESHDC